MKPIKQVYLSTLPHQYHLWVGEIRENLDVTEPPDLTIVQLPLIPGLMYELYFDHNIGAWDINFYI